MAKYKIALEYDGTNYRGWQSQKNARSVQDTLITAAEKFLDAPVKVQGAGRTDAGVHALEQVAHLESPKKVHPESLRMGINDNLPASVNVLKVENAPAPFHARHHAVNRSYLYLISRRRTAFGKRYVWWVKDKVDCGKMKQALDVFQGFHDFVSFADKRIDKEASTKVNIEGIWLKEFDDIIAVRILGSHFLWKMVRRIVGVTVEVGRGNFTKHDVEKMLIPIRFQRITRRQGGGDEAYCTYVEEAEDAANKVSRRKQIGMDSHSEVPAHYTAPPSGLFLEKVLYEGDKLPPIKLPICLF